MNDHRRTHRAASTLFVLPAVFALLHCSAASEKAASEAEESEGLSTFLAGTYTISDASALAVDGGFFHWSGTTTEALYALTPSNTYQQWQFVPSGSGFHICNVGDGASACLSDGGTTLAIGKAADVWSVTASGAGFTVQDQSSGRYITDAASPANDAAVRVSSTATVWSLARIAAPFQAGTYTISDARAFAIDGGYFHWSGTKAEELYALTASNTYQQWTFSASGSGFTICNVGDGPTACLSDGGSALDVGVASGVWTVTPSGSGYTLVSQSTQHFITDASSPANGAAVGTGTTATAWNLALVGGSTPPPPVDAGPPPPPPPPPPTLAPGFYVASGGNDGNPGTLAAPFATFTRAQSAMRAGSVKTTYIRGGTYAPKDSGQCPTAAGDADTAGCVALLSSADSGETWSYYPPDGYGSASISGGTTQGGYNANEGLWSLFRLNGAKNVTIDGLTMHDFNGNAIAVGWSSAITIENNTVYNGYYNLGYAGDAAGIYGNNCDDCVVSHNVVHDIFGMGIRWYISTNLQIAGNVVSTTCTGVPDCGGIYYQDVPMTSTGVHIAGNYVHDGNLAAAGKDGAVGSGIYLDDCTSNVTVSGNVMTGRNGNNTTMIHGGSNNVFAGNLTDLSSYDHLYMAIQTSGACASGFGNVMSGNRYVNNVVVGDIARMGAGNWAVDKPQNPLLVSNNDFFGYGGTTVTAGGEYAASSSASQDPQLSCWVYDLASGSPVTGAPTSFPGLTRGWGPPGYSIPQTGTPPSSPHGC